MALSIPQILCQFKTDVGSALAAQTITKEKKKGRSRTQLILMIDLHDGRRYVGGMSRRARVAPGGLVYHVLNRTVARYALFNKDGDYQAFERVRAEALQDHPIRMLGYCLMPNHWHLVLWPKKDGELTAFMRWPVMEQLEKEMGQRHCRLVFWFDT